MIGALMDATAVVVKYGAAGTDRLGRSTSGELARVSTPARLEQTGSSEGTEYVANRWIGYFPLDVEIGAEDRVEADGKTFAVEGTPSARTLPGAPAMSHQLVYLLLVGA